MPRKSLTRRGVLKAATAGGLVFIQPAVGAAIPAEVLQRIKDTADLVIPGEGQMPSASQAGVLAYFDRRASEDADFARRVTAFFGLPRLRVKVLTAAALREIEIQHVLAFAEFRDTVYEAYYTNPAVWKLLDYNFRKSASPQPRVAPFDEKVLARVRTMKPFYRDVR